MAGLDMIEFIGIWCKNRQIVGGLCIAAYTYEFNGEESEFTIVNVYNKTLNTKDLDVGAIKRMIIYIESFTTDKTDVKKYFNSVIKNLNLTLKQREK